MRKAVKLDRDMLLSCHHMTPCVSPISCTVRCPHSVGLTVQALLSLPMRKLVRIIVIAVIIVALLTAGILQVVAAHGAY